MALIKILETVAKLSCYKAKNKRYDMEINELAAFVVSVRSYLYTLLVALVGLFINSLLNREHKRRERFVKAADDFRSAFHGAVSRLTDTREIYFSGFHLEYAEHRKAAVAFREQLPGISRKRFDEAWNKYEDYCDKDFRTGGIRSFPAGQAHSFL